MTDTRQSRIEDWENDEVDSYQDVRMELRSSGHNLVKKSTIIISIK
jgi:hypothetical protein